MAEDPPAVSRRWSPLSQSEDFSALLHRTKKNDLHPVKINTKLGGEKTISFQGRNYWNKLPNNLKEVTSVALFKRKLKQHILDNY